jgi:hypothetical protein
VTKLHPAPKQRAQLGLVLANRRDHHHTYGSFGYCTNLFRLFTITPLTGRQSGAGALCSGFGNSKYETGALSVTYLHSALEARQIWLQSVRCPHPRIRNPQSHRDNRELTCTLLQSESTTSFAAPSMTKLFHRGWFGKSNSGLRVFVRRPSLLIVSVCSDTSKVLPAAPALSGHPRL